jgi:hypothetical protein
MQFRFPAAHVFAGFYLPSAGAVYIFHRGAQYFCHTPCLRNTANRTMGRIAFKDFRDLTKSGVCPVIFECGEPRLCLLPGRLAATVNLYIRSEEWPY